MSRGDKTQLLDDLPAFSRQAQGGAFLAIAGPDRGDSTSIREGQEVYFGSSTDCQMRLTDKTVSRRHLKAVMKDNKAILIDQGSTNGTFIHGSRFKEISIGHGAEFKLGRTVIKYLPEEEIVTPEPSPDQNFGQLIGGDTKLRQLFKLMSDIAPTQATCLIEGETGTGKELIAEELHNHSDRKNGPFVVFDCGSVPRELIESALFGHMKGSFTGAVSDRKGAFAEAHGGTIFLDEIGEMAIDLQPSLLRVLDKRAIRRVGSNTYENIDVRVVAATNRDLRAEVQEKNFREDLYYRLAVIRLSVPPLRERGNDIPVLVEHFMSRFAPSGTPGQSKLRLTPEDMQTLQRHDWPGNVRELRNAVERACLLANGEYISLDDALLQSGDAGPAMGVRTDLPFKEAKGQLVEMFEREYIEDLMTRHSMNLSAAAREAQIDRKHLRELIRKYDLDPRK
tara:strand:- start:30430 stop:31782 length:1353 start_codon:yes stop_codon:yes gene_type:complete